MRVPPPPQFKLTAEALLADVRARLAERLPDMAREKADPADPGWILLEQSAWMVEQLSTQLDAWPMGCLQQFLHLTGAQFEPALPAVGVVALSVARGGTLRFDPDTPAPLRFFVPQTETSGMLEFVPVEPGYTLRRMAIASLAEIRDGELYQGTGTWAPDALVAWSGESRRSGAFRGERIRYRFVAANPAELKQVLTSAVEKMQERRVGWLRLEVEEQGPGAVSLVAYIDPAHAFAAGAPGGVTLAGELAGDWGGLDDCGWTPPIHLTDSPLLATRLRGRGPLPGAEEGRVVFPSIPANLSLDGLVVRRAAPIPTDAAVAIWTTLTHLDTRLAAYRPTLRRVYAAAEPGDPRWLGGAIDSELWFKLTSGPASVAHVRLQDVGAGTVRIGVVLAAGDPDRLPIIRVYGEDLSGNLPDLPLPHEVAFRLAAPARSVGAGMDLVVGLEISVDASTAGLLVVVDGGCAGILTNAVLVAQAPAVRDGRTVAIERSVPEAASLLYPDVVGPEVLARLTAEPFAGDVRALLTTLPMARFKVSGQEPLRDYQGLAVDSAAGQVMFNGIDRDGRQRTLRRGDSVELTWYRRTDGGRGNVPAGAIRLVEQANGSAALVDRVANPLATFYGANRETDRAAMDRLFGPGDAAPVLPADFERLIRHALGARGEGWEVRCWTWAERALGTTSLWPVPSLGAPPDPERLLLLHELAGAGPEKLLVLIGPRQGLLADADLDWARRATRGLIQRLSRRTPALRDAIVGRLWPLTLTAPAIPSDLLLPCFCAEELDGVLTDALGRSAPPPRGLLLNGAILHTRVLTGTGERR